MSKTSEGSTLRDGRAARILANSLFRDMRQNGYECSQILALATELIDLVTKDMSGACNNAELVPPTAVTPTLRSVG
jgi:hypothetical protein